MQNTTGFMSDLLYCLYETNEQMYFILDIKSYMYVLWQALMTILYKSQVGQGQNYNAMDKLHIGCNKKKTI